MAEISDKLVKEIREILVDKLKGWDIKQYRLTLPLCEGHRLNETCIINRLCSSY